MSVLRPLFLGFVCWSLIWGGEKPSPFAARTSAPAAPPAAPVSPVAPVLSILKAMRPRPFVAGGMPVSNSVSPVSRPSAGVLREVTTPPPPPPPSVEKVAPSSTGVQLKTVALEVPTLVVASMVVASIRPPQVAEIEKGMAKNAVVSKLGNPSTVISMYEDSRFLESLRYEWKGQWLGTVRFVNGQVSRVDQP